MSTTPALYIVRKHDRKGKPWELPLYFASIDNRAWIDGHWIHASAAVLTLEEAQRVVDRYPGSVMLRVG